MFHHGSTGHPFVADRSRLARFSNAHTDALTSDYLGEFEQAETEFMGKTVIGAVSFFVAMTK